MGAPLAQEERHGRQEDIALVDAIVNVARRLARRQVRHRRRTIGQRVAARDCLRLARRQLEGEKLPRQERWQGRAVRGLEVEGTLGLRVVLELTTRHAELAPPRPGAGRRRAYGRVRLREYCAATARQ
jgi:hypothetical protein